MAVEAPLRTVLLLSVVTAFSAAHAAAPVAPAPQAELVGQVVCSNCWLEADRATIAYGTPSDLECAARCAADGVPPALAVRDGDGYELILIEGARDWLPEIGRFVRVRGDLHPHGERTAILADAVERLDGSPWADPHAFEPEGPAWTDLAGHRQSLEMYRGRIVVLNYWATWCAPCLKEIPDLVRIQDRFGIYGVQVLAAAADGVERAADVARFAKKRDVNFPVLLGATTDQMRGLGLGPALPATVVLDRDGRVVERFEGVFEPAALGAALDRVVFDDDHAAAPRRVAHEHAAGDGHGHPRSPTEAALVPS